ncbi:MAG: hypothetical protein HC894_24085 [Microcoleus sp. SM1_3_4]|nr:hypothetical protein [Microcoleus sp. SM1_3_4]
MIAIKQHSLLGIKKKSDRPKSKISSDRTFPFFPKIRFRKTSLLRINCQLSTVNCQLSTVNCQLSTVNYSSAPLPHKNCPQPDRTYSQKQPFFRFGNS